MLYCLHVNRFMSNATILVLSAINHFVLYYYVANQLSIVNFFLSSVKPFLLSIVNLSILFFRLFIVNHFCYPLCTGVHVRVLFKGEDKGGEKAGR